MADAGPYVGDSWPMRVAVPMLETIRQQLDWLAQCLGDEGVQLAAARLLREAADKARVAARALREGD